MIPLVSTIDEGTWNISPTKATQTGGDFISQEKTGIFGRGNVAVHYSANSHTYYCSLLTQSYVHKLNQLFLAILMLFETFQDHASQIPRFLQGFLYLPFMADRLLWKIGKLDNQP